MIGYALFFCVSAVIVASSLAMLFSRDFVHSVVFLAVALMSFSVLYALLDATFLALLQLFLYAGAVTVVLVFVVMLMRPKASDFRGLLHAQTALSVIAAIFIAIPLVRAVVSVAHTLPVDRGPAATTRELAIALMGPQAVPFELASIVLLTALVGAIYLAREAE